MLLALRDPNITYNHAPFGDAGKHIDVNGEVVSTLDWHRSDHDYVSTAEFHSKQATRLSFSLSDGISHM